MKDVKKQLDRLDKQIFWTFAAGITASVLLLIAVIVWGIIRACA